MNKENQPFGEVLYAYTRKQALEDGLQIDVSKVASEAGIRLPTFMTRAVFESCVAVPADVSCQDQAIRLWDIVWMFRNLKMSRPGQSGALREKRQSSGTFCHPPSGPRTYAILMIQGL